MGTYIKENSRSDMPTQLPTNYLLSLLLPLNPPQIGFALTKPPQPPSGPPAVLAYPKHDTSTVPGRVRMRIGIEPRVANRQAVVCIEKMVEW